MKKRDRKERARISRGVEEESRPSGPKVLKPLPAGQVRSPVKIIPGQALKEADFTAGRMCLVRHTPRLEYKWDAGVAIGRYLAGLKQGKLLGRYCRHCNRTLIPPRMFCERCFKPTTSWVKLADTGTVNTFSLCYITWDMQRRTEPQIPAVIEIDGASRGIGIMHLLGEVEPARVRIGMRVKAVWKEPAAREGAITDIKYFKPYLS